MGDGIVEVQRRLSRLSDEMQGKVVKSAARASATVIAREAKRLVPVRSGLLRKSIGVAIAKRGDQPQDAVRFYILPKSKVNFTSRVTVGGRTGKMKSRMSSYHGGFVEFGTKNMAAQPYLYPAAQRKKDESLRVFRSRIYEGVDKVLAGVAS